MLEVIHLFWLIWIFGVVIQIGKLRGLVAKVKKVASEFQSIHCVVHQEALAAKGMPDNQNSVHQIAVKVNKIKAKT